MLKTLGMAGNTPTICFMTAWTKFTATHSDEMVVELSRSINVSLVATILSTDYENFKVQYI
jgi:hypothetical protein